MTAETRELVLWLWAGSIPISAVLIVAYYVQLPVFIKERWTRGMYLETMYPLLVIGPIGPMILVAMLWGGRRDAK